MKNMWEKTFCFIDRHQNAVAYSSLIITIISEILYVYFHTYEYGYSSTISENIPNAVFVPLVIAITIFLIKSSKLVKRFASYVYCLFFLISVIKLIGALYCIFIGDLSPIQVIILSVPLIIGFILLCVSFFKQSGISAKVFLNQIKTKFGLHK